MRARLALPLLFVSLLSAPAGALELQKSGPQAWPGKLQVGVNPFGVQVAFEGRSTGGYKLAVDVSGLLKEMSKVSLWLGGGLGYAHPSYSCGLAGGCSHDVQIWAFVTLTFEKLMKLPLVPFARAGIGGDILSYPFSNLGGAFAVRVGGGIHYWLFKNIGLGVETNFSFGPGIYPVASTFGCGLGNTTCVGFFGNWDLLFGGRFAF